MTETITYCIRGCTVRDKHLPACTCTPSCEPHDDHCTGCQPRSTYEGNLCRGCIQRIHNSLTQIVTDWDAMMPEPKVGNGSGSALTLITRDDNDEREDDVPRLDGVIDTRAAVLTSLRKVAQTVVQQRQLHLPPKHDDLQDLVRFLTRHVDWLATHPGIENIYDTIRTADRKVHQVAYPTRSDFVHLGACPFVIDNTFCTGQVRSRIGDDPTASCSGCHQTGPVQWWEEVLGITSADTIVNSADMARLLYQQLHVAVSEQTVRRWGRDGRITPFTPFGPQPKKPRWWFQPRVVLDEVAHMDRECPTCGQPWSGVGEVCSRCYTAQRNARPEHAERKPATPAPISLVWPLAGWCRWPRNVVPDSHDTDRPDRCHYSDLPIDQCACGRIHERTSA